MNAMNGTPVTQVKSKTETAMRPYHPSDTDFLVAGICKYVPELPHYKDVTIAPERIKYLLQHNFGGGSNFAAWVLVDPETNQLVGGVAGYCVPGMLTWDLVAQDVFLFVLPEYRSLRNLLKLMTVYKDWAKARGAKLIMASYMGGHRSESMAKVMVRQGYMEAGTLWMMRLDDGYLNRV